MRTDEDNQMLVEINDLSKKGQELKRKGRIIEAIKLLENGIEHYRQIFFLPPEGMAALKKSIAKLYYLQRDYRKAAMEYIEAVDSYYFESNVEQATICIYHLGCCSIEFHKSPFAPGYFHGLLTGIEHPPGTPDFITPDVAVQITNWGIKIYNDHHEKVISSFPRVCPICNKSDESLKLFAALATGMQKVGKDWLLSPWAQSFVHYTGFGEKPENREEAKNWSRANAREDLSFYCFRCDTVFYSEHGTKKSSPLCQCKEMFYKIDDENMNYQPQLTPLSVDETIGNITETKKAEQVNEWVIKGKNLSKAENYQEAIHCFDQALIIDPGNPRIWCNKGNSLSSLDREIEAINCYNRALELDINYGDAWYCKGCCLDSLNHHEEALQCYEQALLLDPLEARIWMGKFLCLLHLGRFSGKLINAPQKTDPHIVPSFDGSYEPGDMIGHKYEVLQKIGEGGYGSVYLVFSHEIHLPLALKTIRGDAIEDPNARSLFYREASLWVNLEHHPYIVWAMLVEEINGRLYIAMEYIGKNEDGLNSLEGYLSGKPLDLNLILRWAIQFCHGMEYAHSKGIRSHRDIKPSNILIDIDRNVQISDFGLASIAGGSRIGSREILPVRQGQAGISIQSTDGIIGTPIWMAPEQFIDASKCDERSDIYSFGIVLYQMVSGGYLPFLPLGLKDNSSKEQMRFLNEMRQMHFQSPAPSLSSPLNSTIHHCLDKDPKKRVQSFHELRLSLEILLKQETGEIIPIPSIKKQLDSAEWNSKGLSLASLGRHEEALDCYDEALHCKDKYAQLSKFKAMHLCNKGGSLFHLGRFEEAIRCFNQTTELDPNHHSAWIGIGCSLNSLGQYEKAMLYFDKILAKEPNDYSALNNKANSLKAMIRHKEAILYYDKALKIDPKAPAAWGNKGACLAIMGQKKEALLCFERALEIDPFSVHNLINKAICLENTGQHQEAVMFCDKAIDINPKEAEAWFNKGISLNSMRQYGDVIMCYEKTLQIDPSHFGAWINKALAHDQLGQLQEAEQAYKQFLALTPNQDTANCRYARKRIIEME